MSTTIHEDDVLRPREWAEFIGQASLKDQLDVAITAAIKDNPPEGRPLEHVLLDGPPGFGKTSLASIIASRLGDPFTAVKMPIKPAALKSILRQWDGGVLFLDEIHNASKAMQEDLFTVLEGGYLSLPNGGKIRVDWLTVIAATTEPEKIIPPLYQRFDLVPEFEAYSPEEMATIVEGMCRRLGVKLADETYEALGRAAGGTPRICKKLVKAARNLGIAHDCRPSAEEILKHARVDRDGLTAKHMAYLNCLDDLGGTAGLRLLSSTLRLHEVTLRELERTLFDQKLISPTERGREITSAGSRKVRGEQVSHVRRQLVQAG